MFLFLYSDPMDCSLPGSPVYGIFQARTLEWGAIAFSERKLRNVQICLCPYYVLSTRSVLIKVYLTASPLQVTHWSLEHRISRVENLYWSIETVICSTILNRGGGGPRSHNPLPDYQGPWDSTLWRGMWTKQMDWMACLFSSMYNTRQSAICSSLEIKYFPESVEKVDEGGNQIWTPQKRFPHTL